MLKAASREVAKGLVSLLGVSLLAFTVLKLMPGDPVDIALRSWSVQATPETVAALRDQWGLDQPWLLQYPLWLVRFILGDWGISFRTSAPILAEFTRRLPLTLLLGLGGLILAVILAVPVGFASAQRPGGIADTASRGLAVLMQAVPVFWLGLGLIWILSVHFRVLTPFAATPQALVLPVLLIALQSLGILSRVYRREMLRVPLQMHFRTALAKGLSRDAALWRHGHLQALYALIAAVRSQAGWAIGSTATIEVLFGLPGISQFLVQSIAARDFFVLQAYVMVIALWMVAMNTLLTTVLARIDPRLS